MPVTYSLGAKCLAEFIGSGLAIYFGNGTVTNAIMPATKGNKGINYLGITIGYGLAFGVPIMIFNRVSAMFNPAVGLSELIRGNLSLVEWLAFTCCETAGSFVGGCLVYATYYEHYRVCPKKLEPIECSKVVTSSSSSSSDNSTPVNSVHDAGGVAADVLLRDYQAAIEADQATKLSTFCTRPAIYAPVGNFVTEVLATAALILCLGLMGDRFPSDMDTAAGPMIMAAFIVLIGLSVGGPTGYALNPARDLGPRIAHMLLPIPGKGSSEFKDYGWIPITAPCLGAALGAGLHLCIARIF